MTLVRSPTSTGRLSSAGSSDLDAADRGRARGAPARAAAGRPPARASARMWAGVVPQQPPTTLTQPSSTKRRILSARLSGRLLVVAVLVGQAGVRVHAHEARGDRRERAQVVGHELRAGGAVEPDREEVDVLERGIERLDVLAGEHRAHGLDGAADHDRELDARPRAIARSDADAAGLDVAACPGRSRAAGRRRRPR